MTLQEMKDRKRELGYSNETIARLSGVPLGTVQKVLGGFTKSPRQKTLEKLAEVLEESRLRERKQDRRTEDKRTENREGNSAIYQSKKRQHDVLQEAKAEYGTAKKVYTIEDIYALPDGVRAELIDGRLYYMATPTRTHQRLAGEMHLAVANYIKSKGGSCEVYIPPFAVYLMGDESTYLEPDLTVVCDLSKLDEKGCWGAPDWVVEVLSPSTAKKDMGIKLSKYRAAGVRELWFIHPEKRIVLVFHFDRENEIEEEKEAATIYSFEDEITSGIFPDLTIVPASMLWQ